MSEVLFWIAAVFAILGLPPLLGIWWELRRERREARQRERQRRFEEAHRHELRGSDGPLGSASSPGAWSGMFVAAWIL